MTEDEILQAADAVQAEMPSAVVRIGRKDGAKWLECRTREGRCFATAACRDGGNRWLASLVSTIRQKWKD